MEKIEVEENLVLKGRSCAINIILSDFLKYDHQWNLTGKR
jgi:hypothetical protein